MTNTELLAKLSDAITPEIKAHFDKMILADIVDNRPNIDNYENAIAFYIKDEILWDREHIISYLKEQKLMAENVSVDYVTENDLIQLIMVAIRSHLLKEHGPFSTYEDKLIFILESNHIFNFFRKYDIPGYDEFSGFPTTKEEKLTFITFIANNYYKIEKSFDYSCTRIRDTRTFESLKAEFLFSISKINYLSKIDGEKSKFSELIKSDYLKEYWLYSFTFFEYLEKHQLNLEDILLATNNPVIYYIILFFKDHVIHYVKYINFINNFEYSLYEKQVNYYQIDKFSFQNYKGTSHLVQYFDDYGKIIIKGTDEFIHALKKLIGNEILKSDLVTILDSLGRVGTLLLNNISSNMKEPYVEKSLKKNAKTYIAIYNSLSSNHVKTIFFQTFIEYLYQIESTNLTPSRIAYIKSQFDNYSLKDTESKLITTSQQQNDEIQKIKMSISAKQLALFIRLLFKSEIIDNNKHKVEPLMQLISTYFSSIDTDDITAGSLGKNYYSTDYHSDLSVLKVRLNKMLQIIDDMQKK